jgi:hypothetical protein
MTTDKFVGWVRPRHNGYNIAPWRRIKDAIGTRTQVLQAIADLELQAGAPGAMEYQCLPEGTQPKE